jgi:hypothetical protein
MKKNSRDMNTDTLRERDRKIERWRHGKRETYRETLRDRELEKHGDMESERETRRQRDRYMKSETRKDNTGKNMDRRSQGEIDNWKDRHMERQKQGKTNIW